MKTNMFQDRVNFSDNHRPSLLINIPSGHTSSLPPTFNSSPHPAAFFTHHIPQPMYGNVHSQDTTMIQELRDDGVQERNEMSTSTIEGLKMSLSSSKSPRLSSRAIRNYYFNGIDVSVDLLAAVTNLLNIIHYKLLPVLEVLISNQNMVQTAHERYKHFLTCSDSTRYQKYLRQINFLNRYSSSVGNADDQNSINGICAGHHPQDTANDYHSDEDISWYAIWVCHMIDSWAYLTDCRTFNPSGSIVDHKLSSDDGKSKSFDFSELNSEMQSLTTKAINSPMVNGESENIESLPTNHNRTDQIELSFQIESALGWLHRICHTFTMPHYKDDKFKQTSIVRYHIFLAILKSHPAMFSSIPRPADIMLVWMAHCLHPRQYRNDIRLMLGDSSIVLLERVLVQPQSYSLTEINDIWHQYFDGSDLILPGTMHRPLLRYDSLRSCDGFSVACLKPLLTVVAYLTDATHVPTDNWFIDLDEDDFLIPVRKNVQFECRCDLELWPVRIGFRQENRNQLKQTTVGFLKPPFTERCTVARFGRNCTISVMADYFTFRLRTQPFGVRPLPHILSQFLDRQVSDLNIYWAMSNKWIDGFSLHDLRDASTSLSNPSTSICFHFLKDAAAVFLFFEEGSPSILCRQVNALMLPRGNQLDRPDDYPHASPCHSTFIVSDSCGERLAFVVNQNKSRKEVIKMYILDETLSCESKYVDMPKCSWFYNGSLSTSSSSIHLPTGSINTPPLSSSSHSGYVDRHSSTGSSFIDIRTSHSTLQSVAFPFLLCASFTFFLLNVDDDFNQILNCTRRTENDLARLDNNMSDSNNANVQQNGIRHHAHWLNTNNRSSILAQTGSFRTSSQDEYLINTDGVNDELTWNF